jgi:transposase
MRPLPKAITDNAIVLMRNGQSARAAAKALGISVSSAIRIQRKDKEDIPPIARGRPAKVHKRTKTLLAKQMKIGTLESIHEAQQFIESTEGVHVHGETVRRYLRNEGVKAFVQPKKPDLTRKQRFARRKFAKEHLSWTTEDWKRVMFSDETMICRIGHFGRKFYYKAPEDHRLLPHQVQRRQQGGGGKILVWGCITYNGVGDACKFSGSVDSEMYVSALRDYVLASRDWNELDPATFIFQQDNAPIHTSHQAKEYLAEANIDVLEWPANSPDLNIIEDIWAYINRRLSTYRKDPRTLDELWERVQDIWTTIPIETIHNLYASLPRRMQMVYKNRGGNTRY